MTLQLIENSLNNSALLKLELGANHNKYVMSVLNEIKRTAADEKKSLVNCAPDSIISAIKQACDLQLEIDGRQHCHLVKYGNSVNLQIGYRGFIYAIKRAYQDANIDCKLVYKDDVFVVKSEGDTTTYSLEVKNPFARSAADIIGGYCHISYTLGGRLVSFCETMSLAEINKIKGKAKQDFIWKEWFEEKAKVAIIRRACKIHFSGIQQIEQMAEFDNQDYDLDKVIENKVDTIDTEQGIEIQNLANKKGILIDKICEVYGLASKLIIDLPLDKFDEVKERLNQKPDIQLKNEVKNG
jgi:recombination protein RecT